MKKNRYLLCLLACGFMLYFAVPRLSLTLNDAKGAFSVVWLLFALLVVAGNLSGLLYHPRKELQHSSEPSKHKLAKKKRSFH